MPTKSLPFAPRYVQHFLLFLWITGLFISHVLLQLAAFLLIVWYLVRFTRNRRVEVGAFPVLIALFFLLGVLALFRTSEPVSHTSALLPQFILLASVALVYLISLQPEKIRDRWLIFTILLATIVAIAGWAYHFGGVDRTRGFFGGYFTLATLMTFTIPITAARLFHSKTNSKVLLLFGSLLLQVAALWWTFTRSAFLGLVIAMGFWTMALVSWKLGRGDAKGPLSWDRIVLVSLVPIMLVTLVFTSSDPRINPLTSRGATVAESQKQDFTSGRKSIWLDAKRILETDLRADRYGNLLLGHGLQSRKRLIGNEYTSWESDYLQGFMDMGLLGLTVVILIYVHLITAIRRAFRNKKILSTGMATAGMAFFLMSFFTLQLCSFHGAGILGIIVAFLHFPPKAALRE